MCFGRPATSRVYSEPCRARFEISARGPPGCTVPGRSRFGGEPACNELVVIRIEIAKAQVLELPLDLPHAETIRKRCVDFARLVCNALTFRPPAHPCSRNRCNCAASLISTSRGSVTIASSILRSASAWFPRECEWFFRRAEARLREPRRSSSFAIRIAAGPAMRDPCSGVIAPPSTREKSAAPVRMSSSSVNPAHLCDRPGARGRRVASIALRARRWRRREAGPDLRQERAGSCCCRRRPSDREVTRD